MLIPFSYNDRVCQKTDVLARGTKMYNLTIPKDWLLILTAGHSNLDLLWDFLSFKNSLIYIRRRNWEKERKESNQNLLPWDSKFKAGGGTVTGLFGKYRNRIVSSYVVVRRKECTSKNPKKEKKGGKDKIRLFIRRSKGRWDLSKCFTHVLGFSNHKHIAWVFVQENKQSLSRCPLAIYKTPWKELVFHSEDWDGAWQLWTLPRVEEAKWAISWAES